MAWYPGAKKMELQPESDAQPAIRPTQFILHSIVAPWTPERTYEYWRDSTNLESHFGLGYDGSLGQYIGTETRADATGAANRRADGTGAVSIETASNTKASDPWTDAQVEALIKLGVWLHQHHGIPLRICRTWDDPGFGYHCLFKEWNPDAHACPGDARVKQFHQVVFPGIVARANGQTTNTEEDSMPTAQEIARAILDEYKVDDPRAAGTNYIPLKQLLWFVGADAGHTRNAADRVEDEVKALAAKVDALAVGGVDLDALAARVADLLAARLAN